MCWFTARAWSYAGLAGCDPLAQHRFRRRNDCPAALSRAGSRAPSGTVQWWRSRAFPQLRPLYPGRRPPHASRRSLTSRRLSQGGRPSCGSRCRARSGGPAGGTRGLDSPPKPPGVHHGPLSLAYFHSTTREGCQAMLKMQIAVGLAVKITMWSSPSATPGTTLR